MLLAAVQRLGILTIFPPLPKAPTETHMVGGHKHHIKQAFYIHPQKQTIKYG